MSSCVFPLSANRVKILEESLHVDFDLNLLFIYCFSVDINESTTLFHSLGHFYQMSFSLEDAPKGEVYREHIWGPHVNKLRRRRLDAAALTHIKWHGWLLKPPDFYILHVSPSPPKESFQIHIYMFIIIFKFLSLEIKASNSTVFNQQLLTRSGNMVLTWSFTAAVCWYWHCRLLSAFQCAI